MKKLFALLVALVGLTTASVANEAELAKIKKIEPLLYDFIYKHTDYDKSLELPPINYQFKDRQELNTIYYGKKVDDPEAFQVLALYNSGVVSLRDNFSVTQDAWVLLHELVHHVQFHSGRAFDCPQDMEFEAYNVMDKYVEVSGNGQKTDPMFKMLMNCRPELELR